MKLTQNTQYSQKSIDTRASAVAPALLALLFGAFLVIGTGFAHSDTIHNAAHDSRHSFAFPCH